MIMPTLDTWGMVAAFVGGILGIAGIVIWGVCAIRDILRKK